MSVVFVEAEEADAPPSPPVPPEEEGWRQVVTSSSLNASFLSTSSLPDLPPASPSPSPSDSLSPSPSPTSNSPAPSTPVDDELEFVEPSSEPSLEDFEAPDGDGSLSDSKQDEEEYSSSVVWTYQPDGSHSPTSPSPSTPTSPSLGSFELSSSRFSASVSSLTWAPHSGTKSPGDGLAIEMKTFATVHIPHSQPAPLELPDQREQLMKERNWRSVLILIPLRLGIHKLNPEYISSLLTCFEFPESVGFVGGRPNSSFYFVGCQDERVFYLDPHTVQDAARFDQDFCTESSSYHCSTIRSMPIQDIDPSLAIGFYCRTYQQFLQFWERAKKLTSGKCPLFSLAEHTPPSYDYDGWEAAPDGQAKPNNANNANNNWDDDFTDEDDMARQGEHEDDDFVLI
eukprot:TRINITY_DN5110_c0_g6_i1.p1 TRINITY_DN5110_c0_g6~~TRINITY_DN5110_c0_g6_i1.p1  ORF type:complete len:445 (+),score=97.05 TRINITY_DN5110_c0_g6_i1:142-1335(+)